MLFSKNGFDERPINSTNFWKGVCSRTLFDSHASGTSCYSQREKVEWQSSCSFPGRHPMAIFRILHKSIISNLEILRPVIETVIKQREKWVSVWVHSPTYVTSTSSGMGTEACSPSDTIPSRPSSRRGMEDGAIAWSWTHRFGLHGPNEFPPSFSLNQANV